MHLIHHSGPTKSGNERTERHFFHNTERRYHCIIMHIFKKQKQKQKQSIIKLNKQSIHLTYVQCGLISGIKTCSAAVL